MGLQQTPEPVILPEHRFSSARSDVVVESGGSPTGQDRSGPTVYADAVQLHRIGLRCHGARLPTARLESGCIRQPSLRKTLERATQALKQAAWNCVLHSTNGL